MNDFLGKSDRDELFIPRVIIDSPGWFLDMAKNSGRSLLGTGCKMHGKMTLYYNYMFIAI